MIPRNRALPITLTKLKRPRTVGKIIPREQLNANLETSRSKPLILVSAPAGYGKSTLISDWLDRVDGPKAWLSLDEADSDIWSFVRYLLAAIQSAFPESCEETSLLLKADDPPSTQLIAGTLSNDLMALAEPLILVLEDYHCITEPEIHDLLDQLLAHPPDPLHLIIASRLDPPLSISEMRAHGVIGSVRAKDLRFTKSETAAVIAQEIGRPIDEPALDTIYEFTEGWPVGVRLAASAMQDGSAADSIAKAIGGNATQIEDYLLTSILFRQTASARKRLCRAALFDRICAPLCEAVFPVLGEADAEDLEGSDFIQLLLDSGLPHQALDETAEWYRFHHVIQNLLLRQLEKELSPEEISELYLRAAAWFEAQGLVEEAIDYSLRAGEPAAVARLISRQRDTIIIRGDWHSLNSWLHKIPSDIIENDPELLLLQAWLELIRGQPEISEKIIEKLGELLDEDRHKKSGAVDRISAAVDVIRGQLLYNEASADRALKHLERALVHLPDDWVHERSYAMMHLAGAHQMLGDGKTARHVVYEALADSHEDSGVFQTRMMAALSFFEWMDGDLSMLRQTATQLMDLANALGQVQSSMIGRYFMAIFHYERNELSESERYLRQAVKKLRFANERYFAQCAYVQALVYQATGRPEEAKKTAEFAYAHMLKFSNVSALGEAQAFQAELALRQGNLAKAKAWARQFDPEPFRPMFRHYQPVATQIKTFIAQNSAEGNARAADLLDRFERFVIQTHNTRFQILMHVLKARLLAQQEDQPAAQQAMRDAIVLGQPGGFIRLFVDLGSGLDELLRHLDMSEEEQRYIDRILSAISEEQANPVQSMLGAADVNLSAEQQNLLQDLTNRELEILSMFAERLSNKEIARKLGISASTVKRHGENIYMKLGVHGRREAAAVYGELLKSGESQHLIGSK